MPFWFCSKRRWKPCENVAIDRLNPNTYGARMNQEQIVAEIKRRGGFLDVRFNPKHKDKHLKGASKQERIAYLNACLGDLDDDGLEAFFQGLQDIARANGIYELAKKADKSRDTLNKMFSHKNPTVDTFRCVLNELGMDIAIIARK